MARILRSVVGGLLLLCLAPLPAFSLGPVDGEVALLWWQSDFDRDTEIENISVDAAAPGVRGELWLFDKFGFRASMFSSDLGDLGEEDADYVSADVMWKLVSPTEKTYLALGLGYQDMDFTESGLGPTLVETSGMRVSAEGRIGLIAVLQAYGSISYLPDLDDFQTGTAGDMYTDLEGQEVELGLAWKIGPFVDMRAGYRTTEYDFARQLPAAAEYAGTVENAGFMIGMGVHF